MTHLSAHIIIFWTAIVAIVSGFALLGAIINRRLVLRSRQLQARPVKVFKRK